MKITIFARPPILRMLIMFAMLSLPLVAVVNTVNAVSAAGTASAVTMSTEISSPHGVGRAHERLRRILAEPPFQQWRLREHSHQKVVKNPLWHAIGRQWDRLMKWLGHYFHPRKHRSLLGHHGNANFSFANFLEIIGLVVGVALVAGIVMVLFRWQALGKAAINPSGGLLSRDKMVQAMEQGDALAMASDSWMRAARQFGNDGDFRAMYRAMYLALLAGLHENGKIRFRRNRTNWHYVRDFHGTSPDRQLFGSLTDLFDHVWYGRKLYPDIRAEILRDQIDSLVVLPEKSVAVKATVQSTGNSTAYLENPRA